MSVQLSISIQFHLWSPLLWGLDQIFSNIDGFSPTSHPQISSESWQFLLALMSRLYILSARLVLKITGSQLGKTINALSSPAACLVFSGTWKLASRKKLLAQFRLISLYHATKVFLAVRSYLVLMGDQEKWQEVVLLWGSMGLTNQ